jgi:hypothetical protein
MSAHKITVTCYHSVICPRCRFTGFALRRSLRHHPDIELTKVEFLGNRDRAREDGVQTIPALVAQGRSLTGVILTQRRIDSFLESLTAEREL